MNNSFCPHCRSGHDPVLRDSTWSCGTRFNDAQWRTKECYKRNLELANKRIKRLEEAGDAMEKRLHLRKNISDQFVYKGDAESVENWNKAKEDKL